MNTYIIRIHTIDGIYTDYMVEAEDVLQASNKAKKTYFKDYPGADERIYTQLVFLPRNAKKNIQEIIKYL